MAVRPNGDHPCVLRGKGTQIKYAIRFLRAHFHAKPNISPISARDKVWCHMVTGLTPLSELDEQLFAF